MNEKELVELKTGTANCCDLCFNQCTDTNCSVFGVEKLFVSPGDIDNDHSTSSSDLSQQEALSDDADWLQNLDLGPDDSTSEL